MTATVLSPSSRHRRLGALHQHLMTTDTLTSRPAHRDHDALTTSPVAAAGRAGLASAPGEQPHRQKQGDDATAGDTHTQRRLDLEGDVQPTPLELYQFDLNGVSSPLSNIAMPRSIM